MVDLPTGTVTFLFTDVEGSTRLVKQLGTRYDDVRADQARLLRESFAAHDGHEVDTQGDSFFVAFASAADAVASAIDAQRALAAHGWPEGLELRVRMGLHSGEPRATGERYLGFGVHRAARVAAAGHGGQVLVSSATRELVEDELPPDTTLRDLGSYRLKDVERPERVFQLEAAGLPTNFPPLRAPRIGGSRRRRRALGAVAGVLAAAAGAAVYLTTIATAPTLGSAEHPITIVTPWYERDPEQQAFDEVLRTFEQTTGLQTDVHAAGGDFQTVMRCRLDEGDIPAISFVSPGLLAEYARQGLAKPLEALGIGDDALLESYAKTWVDLARVDGKIYGFPTSAGSKSLIWYRPREFREKGLRIPETWDELLRVTTRLTRVGEAAWAVGGGDSFTLTDWFENIYIRTEGPFKYDALFAGKLPFDDPSVIAALGRMTSLLHDTSLAGGIDGALVTSFPDAVLDFFGTDPDAQLLMEGGFVGSFALAEVRPPPVPGRTIGAAPFPTIDATLGNPVVVGADFVVSFVEDDELGELLLYLMSPGAGRIWVSTGAAVSPNHRIPLSTYPNVLVRTQARQLTSARDVRFDGSDLLPGELAAELGSTLQEVVRRPRDTRSLMETFQRSAARTFNG